MLLVDMFEVSSKVDYALLILLELAKKSDYVALSDIADKRHISPKYLSQIVMPLKQSGLVISREGSKGGYALAAQPDQINLRTIVEAVDGPLQITRCMEPNQHCPVGELCNTKPIWSKLKHSMYQLLEAQTLADVAKL